MSHDQSFNSKILITGEYSIFLGSSALCIPYKKYSGQLDYMTSSPSDIQIDSNKILGEFAKYMALQEEKSSSINSYRPVIDLEGLNKEIKKGLYFKSDIPMGYGIGSSGALVAALYDRFKIEDHKQITSAYLEFIKNIKAEMAIMEGFFHNTSSGIDPLTSYLGKSIYNVGPVENTIFYYEKTPLICKKSLFQLESLQTHGGNKLEAREHIPNLFKHIDTFLIDTGKKTDSSISIGKFHKKLLLTNLKQKIIEKLVPLNNSLIKLCFETHTNAINSLHIKNFLEIMREISIFTIENFDFLIPKEYYPAFYTGIENRNHYLKLCGSDGGGYLMGFGSSSKLSTQFQVVPLF